MPRLTPEQIAARFEARLIRGAITTVRGHGELTRFIGFAGVRTPHILPKPNVLFLLVTKLRFVTPVRAKLCFASWRSRGTKSGQSLDDAKRSFSTVALRS